jgi:hypothetical protein
MVSNNSHVRCQSCEYELIYGEDGYVRENNHPFTLKEMDEANKVRFVNYLQHHPHFTIEFPGVVSFWKSGKARRSRFQRCRFKITENEVRLSIDHHTLTYPIQSVLSAAIQVRTKLIVYLEGDVTLLLQFPKQYSPYAALIYVQYLRHQGGKHDDHYTNEQLASILGL